MTVEVFRVIAGEEIIGDVKDNGDSITVENPAVIAMMPGEDGQMQVRIGPLSPSTDDTKVTIASDKILYRVTPKTELLNYYNQIFGSGLIMPDTNIVK
jgi:hypothetical protein